MIAWLHGDAVPGPHDLRAAIAGHAVDGALRLIGHTADDHRDLRLDDAGLFLRDRGEGMAQVGLVIECDRGDRAAMGVMTLVESSRPPNPTSMTATSTPARRKSSRARAVVASKKVGCARSAPDAINVSTRPRRSSTAATRASWATGRSSIANRSVRSMRWGEVKRADRCPAARSPASTIAVTEPLPLVPAMCTEGNARSGWPSAATSIPMFSSPNLIPKCSSPKR